MWRLDLHNATGGNSSEVLSVLSSFFELHQVSKSLNVVEDGRCTDRVHVWKWDVASSDKSNHPKDIQKSMLQAQVLKEHQLPIPLMGPLDAVELMAFLDGKCANQTY